MRARWIRWRGRVRPMLSRATRRVGVSAVACLRKRCGRRHRRPLNRYPTGRGHRPVRTRREAGKQSGAHRGGVPHQATSSGAAGAHQGRGDSQSIHTAGERDGWLLETFGFWGRKERLSSSRQAAVADGGRGRKMAVEKQMVEISVASPCEDHGNLYRNSARKAACARIC